MTVIEGWTGIIYFAAAAGQFMLLAALFILLYRLLPAKRRRWMHLPDKLWQGMRVTDKRLAFWGISRESTAYRERAVLLAACGVTFDPALYILGRRLAFVICAAGEAMLAVRFARGEAAGLSSAGLAAGALMLTAAIGMMDKSILGAWKKSRTGRIIQEVHSVSVQLLYLQGSALHIHAKLMRCIPFTRTIRTDLQQMLGEWYHDAEGAIRLFKERIGTDEGLSFAETIESLRLHDHPAYYELLRERIRDYKEKLEIIKESRKESSSYLLFVLAGIPILYTFQVFIYPWVRESQKLFEALN